MKKKKQSYFKEEIRRMLLLNSIIPVVILTIVGLIIFWGVTRYTVEKETKYDNEIISSEIEKTVNSYIELIYVLEQQQALYEEQINVNSRVKIFEYIYEVSNRIDKKANIYVFDDTITPIISGTKIIPDFLNGNYASNWGIFRIMKQNPSKISIKLLKEIGSEDMQMVIGKALVSQGKIQGYATFVIDSRQFKHVIANRYSQTVIADATGYIYIANNYSFLDTLERFDLKLEDRSKEVSSNSGKYFISSNHILDNQIYIYSITSLNSLLLKLNYVVVVLLFVFSMMILLVFLTSKKIANKKTKDLYTILETFEKAKEGDLDTQIEIYSNDEFEIIAESYNQMLGSLKEQITRNKEMGKLVAISQTKQLESQFNPHFLYNTLENIRFMCKLEPDLASKMVLNLSTLLRYSISNTKEEVTVREDVAYTENYMSILKFRFNRRFHYTIDISPEIKQCIIPKLLIQPMIENSIKYGYAGKEHLLVEISGYREDDKLIIICSDDGAGMEQNVLEETQQILRNSTNKSNHSGLYNINRRLQLKYGEEYGIQIKSTPGNGTTLIISLPVRYGESSGGNDAENINS